MLKNILRRPFGALALLAFAVLALAGTAIADTTTVTVTQNSTSWAPLDTRPGGSFAFTNAYGAPAGLGSGALELKTDATTAAKADYFTFEQAGTPLADVTDLSYWTYQQSGPPVADASYQLQIDVDGGDLTTGFTTLVFEPYWNTTQGLIVPQTWQDWDVDAGLFWSSKTINDGTCQLVSGAGGPPLYTLAQVQTLCPTAVVLGIGVNIGSFNPSYTVATDGVQFNDTIYDFELGKSPATKDDCKNGGWASFNDPAFKNQGDCVSFVQSNKG